MAGREGHGSLAFLLFPQQGPLSLSQLTRPLLLLQDGGWGAAVWTVGKVSLA